jgi:hypothetical protein
MRSKSSGRSFDLRRDGARRTKDDRLGIQRGRKCIVQGSRASHEYASDVSVSRSMVKEAICAAQRPRKSQEHFSCRYFIIARSIGLFRANGIYHGYLRESISTKKTHGTGYILAAVV